MINMMGHQRDILASLGIDIWVSKGAVCQQLPQSTIWRDQNTPEVMLDITSHVEIATADVLLNDPILSFETEQPKQVQEKLEQKEEPAVVIEQELRPSVILEPFNIQALVLPHLVILMEGSNITSDQQLLWSNIQRAVQAEFTELNWPFALPELQDGYGVESFIQGFLDVISTEKTVLVLGQVPHYTKSNMMHLASLQEMLDEPLLKRRLWKFIKNKV